MKSFLIPVRKALACTIFSAFNALFLTLPPLVLAQTSQPLNLYELALDLETQNGLHTQLASFKGKPLVIAMLYTSCAYACPLIINNIKALERKLKKQDLTDLQVLLVTFDPNTDTPSKLKETASKHKLDLKRWTLARTSVSGTENLAAVLGIKYKIINPQTINHSSVITILAANGDILKQSEKIESELDEFAKALKKH